MSDSETNGVSAEATPGETAETVETPGETDAGALLSRLRLIEDQPLDTRAAAYAQINDALQATLEGGDARR